MPPNPKPSDFPPDKQRIANYLNFVVLKGLNRNKKVIKVLNWFRKRNENVNESEELKQVKAKLTKVEAEILELYTAIDIIRNKVLRKIQFKQIEKDEEEQESWNGIPKTK